MRKPKQIGITGGIGTGKSIVCKIFNALGVPTYDADSRAKAVMTTDGILIEAIKKEFGTLSYKPNGELNREYLSEQVFADEAKRTKLNNLVHPRVALDYEAWLQQHKQAKYVVKEAALLVETKSYKTLDALVLVQAPIKLRINRVMLRDKRSASQVENIIKSQLPEEEKAAVANFRVQNDEQQSLIQQVLTLHKQFTS